MPRHSSIPTERPTPQFWHATLSNQLELSHSKPWLNKQTKLFSIGSCFAANFAKWIALHGVTVSRPGWGLQYNPAAINDEISRSAGKCLPYIQWQSLDDKGRVVFLDPLRHTVRSESAEELHRSHEQTNALARAAFVSSSAFLITLGLAEIWEQQIENGQWVSLNVAPPKDVYNASLHRTRNLSVEETKNYLKQIIATIRTREQSNIPITFTVSPIPMRATFSQANANVANCRSKSILLAALHEVLDNGDNDTFYFPAYELFWGGTNNDDLWQGDGRHPRAEAIENACKTFVNCFAQQPSDFNKQVPFEVPDTP